MACAQHDHARVHHATNNIRISRNYYDMRTANFKYLPIKEFERARTHNYKRATISEKGSDYTQSKLQKRNSVKYSHYVRLKQ